MDQMYLWLFGASALCAVPGVWRKKGRSVWNMLAALCLIIGFLAGLAQGRSLKELQTPLLTVCAILLAAGLLRHDD